VLADATMAGTRWLHRPTGDPFGAPRGPMSTSGPTRSGGRRLGGLQGTSMLATVVGGSMQFTAVTWLRREARAAAR
jgi:hypothetical protein